MIKTTSKIDPALLTDEQLATIAMGYVLTDDDIRASALAVKLEAIIAKQSNPTSI